MYGPVLCKTKKDYFIINSFPTWHERIFPLQSIPRQGPYISTAVAIDNTLITFLHYPAIKFWKIVKRNNVKRGRKSDGPKFPCLFLSGLACQARCGTARRTGRCIGRKEAARSYIRKWWSFGIILSGQLRVAGRKIAVRTANDRGDPRR